VYNCLKLTIVCYGGKVRQSVPDTTHKEMWTTTKTLDDIKNCIELPVAACVRIAQEQNGMACYGVAGFGLRPSSMRKNQSSLIYTYTLWCRTTKFDVVTHAGRGVYLGVSHASHPRERGSSAPHFCGLSCIL